MSVGGSLLRIRALDFRYGPEAPLTLSNVDISVERGECLALLGPSGCGKSTLLRLISGLSTPPDGSLVWTNGTPPKIGFVFQDATLMPWANVFDNVYLPLRLAGHKRAESAPAVAAALAQMDLSEKAEALPSQLSGGMKMRVSLARALVAKPDLLLLDEPFAALDEITRWQLNDRLHRARRDYGLTLVFVSHSIQECAYLADRVAVLSARPGRIASVLDLSALDAAGFSDSSTARDRLSEAFLAEGRRLSHALMQAMASCSSP